MRFAAGIRYRVCVWVILSANTFIHMHGVCIYVRTFVHVVVRACGRILYMRILTRKLMACIFIGKMHKLRSPTDFIVHQEWI